jgi:hypothetical protein
VEALKAIYEEDFRIVNEREKSLRVTITDQMTTPSP